MNKYCTLCGLYKNCKTPCISPMGDNKAQIVFIGETQTIRADEEGQALFSQSYSIMKEVLNRLEVPWYYFNAVRCTPYKDSKVTKPNALQKDSCKAFTMHELLKVKPKVIVAVGNVAVEQLTGITMSMEVLHGKIIYHPQLNCYIVPTFSTSTLHTLDGREGLYKKFFLDDIAIAVKLLQTPMKRRINKEIIKLENPVDIRDFLESLKDLEEIALDLETTGLDEFTDSITDVSITTTVNNGYHITWEDMQEHLDLFKEVLESDIKIIGHNIKFDKAFLSHAGIEIKNIYFDTMLAYHTLEMSFEGSTAAGLFKLKNISWFFTTDGGHDRILGEFGGIAGFQKNKLEEKEQEKAEKDAKRKAKKKKKEVEEEVQTSTGTLVNGVVRRKLLNNELLPEQELSYAYNYSVNELKKEVKEARIEKLSYYAAMDTNVTYRLYKLFKNRLTKEGYDFVFYNIIMPLNDVYFNIEKNGIMLDFDYIEKVKAKNEIEIEEIAQGFFKKIGKEINLNSTQQLAEVMKKVLKVKMNPKFKTPKGAMSTDQNAMKEYVKQAPELEDILRYRGLIKETSTYLDGFRTLAKEDTHRIHPSYLQITTATGRSSCVDPSLHTTPRDNKLRNMVVPREGYKFILADLCLSEGTKIATKRGFIPIENINTEDEVIQEDGTFKKVLNIFNQGTKNVVKLTTQLGYSINLTKEHRIRIINSKGDYIWKCVKDIDIDNEYIAIQPNFNTFKGNINLPKIDYCNAHYNSKIVTTPRNLTEDFCEFLGYLSGDGSLPEYSVFWVTCDKDSEVFEKINTTFENIFNVKINNKISYRGVFQAVYNSKCLSKWFKDIGVSKEKIPDFLWRVDKKYSYAWLRGFFEADGSVGDRISCSSSRESIIKDIQNLLLSLGIVTNIRYQNIYDKRCNKNYNAYHLSIKSGYAHIFKNKIGFISNRKNKKLNKLCLTSNTSPTYGRHPNLAFKSKKYPPIDELKNTRNRGGFVSIKKAVEIKNNYNNIYNDLGLNKIVEWGQIYDKISTIENIGKINTYDIEVEDTHSFIANGFVSHNSQVELRVLALLANDYNMIQAFESGHDFHTATACNMFNIPIEEFNKEDKDHNEKRSVAKIINFSIVYLKTAKSLAVDLKVSVEEAQKFMDTFFNSYNNVSNWIESTKLLAKKQGYVETLYGRRRYLPFIQSSNEFTRESQYRRCINTPVQGTASDITSIGLIRIQDYIDKYFKKEIFMVGTIHDSVILEVQNKLVEQVANDIIPLMTENIPRVPIQLKADLDILDKWVK